MTILTACPICSTPRPANRAGDDPWCCSIACYRRFHGLDGPTTREDPQHRSGSDNYANPSPAAAMEEVVALS
jgi:hypothetical protein